jgi:hypothetical protein
MMLYYKYELVAFKKQEFTSFTFQIWDHYSDFVREDPRVLIRISLIDPLYFMPASSSFSVTLNFEPFVGAIQVSPSTGNSLSTIFQFLISYMQDEDLPLNTNIYCYQDVR